MAEAKKEMAASQSPNKTAVSFGKSINVEYISKTKKCPARRMDTALNPELQMRAQSNCEEY